MDAWRDMDSAELARQYSARGTVPDVDMFTKDYRNASIPMYELPHLHDVRYGPHAEERLDLFTVALTPGRPAAPLFIFIHGGYWRSLAKEDSVFMAKAFVDNGVAVASINYQLSPQASLEDIVTQCRRAFAWLYKNGKKHGVDSSRIVVAGSSAGGHLAAMLMATGWQSALDMPDDAVSGGVLVSGLFDMEPVQRTTPNEWLNLGAQQALALSPIHMLPPASARLCIAVAELDTEEFKRQSLAYAHACRQHGCKVEYFEVARRNHFDIIMDWMDPQTRLTRHTLALFEPLRAL